MPLPEAEAMGRAHLACHLIARERRAREQGKQSVAQQGEWSVVLFARHIASTLLVARSADAFRWPVEESRTTSFHNCALYALIHFLGGSDVKASKPNRISIMIYINCDISASLPDDWRASCPVASNLQACS